MKYPSDLKEIILSTDVKDKKKSSTPNWKLDDWDFIKLEFDSKKITTIGNGIGR